MKKDIQSLTCMSSEHMGNILLSSRNHLSKNMKTFSLYYICIASLLLCISPSYAAGQKENVQSPMMALLLNKPGSNTVIWNGKEWTRSSATTILNSYDAPTYCEELSLQGHTDWRLPTKDELKSLVVCSNGHVTPLEDWDFDQPDTSEYNLLEATCCMDIQDCNTYTVPAISSKFNCVAGEYWTKSTQFVSGSQVWNFMLYQFVVDFSSGRLNRKVVDYYDCFGCGASVSAYVRCVRDLE